jgi:hypothetical protein
VGLKQSVNELKTLINELVKNYVVVYKIRFR